MARRPQPTFADYIVIALSPALIMLLVGSLVFFLIEVFYQGNYDGRLSFIMAMFVMAAVLIARISIEESREYAALFAVPLAIVTALALNRFVSFSGPLASFSLIVNLGLMALIWWCADKLTWDSTVIDESKDASGEGLLQTAGLDAEATTQSAAAEAAAAKQQPAQTLWQRFVAYRRRPHSPGVWVIYFSIAALPIFGFGNWFVPGGDLEARRYVFKLLMVYVSAGLGLLLTTSFLNLRRYLRQRRLEMPASMAGAWIGTGAAMIVGLLLICMLLPRRNAEYSLTQLPFFAGSPTDLWTYDNAPGNDGQFEPDGDRPADRPPPDSTLPNGPPSPQGQPTPSGQPTPGENGSSDGPKTGDQSGSSEPGGSQGGKGPPPKSPPPNSGGEKTPGNEPGNEPGNKPGSDSGDKTGGKQPNGNSGKQPGENPKGGPSGKDGPGGKDKPSDQGESGKENPSGNDRPTGEDKSEETGEAPKGQPDQPPPGQGETPPQQTPPQNGPPQQPPPKNPPNGGSPPKQEPSPPPSDGPQADKSPPSQTDTNSQPQQPRKKFDFSKIPQAIGGTIGNLLKFLYWVIAIALAAFFIWKYWRQVRDALANFWKSLQDFWASLFGRKPSAEEPILASETERVVFRPFAAFQDPFLTGAAHSRPAPEVVRYSFEALEAWAREHGFPREPEQTPHEFAQMVAANEPSVGRDAGHLAELYNRCAYGGGGANRVNVEPLRNLWQLMRELAGRDHAFQ